jgi:L-Ala-D/L-Glu epimerase
MASLQSASIYALRIPFVESFTHRLANRQHCDSVVVKVVDDAGIEGFGEGAPRSYVTGETTEFMIEHLSQHLLPAVLAQTLPTLTIPADLAGIDALIADQRPSQVRSDNASRAALELAILDCILRRQSVAAADLLAVRGHTVTYSGVISADSIETALMHARQMKLIGLQQIKVKVGFRDDVQRMQAIREVVGSEASLRIDANRAWTLPEAVQTLEMLAPYGIAAIEEPLASGSVVDLARLRQETPIPIIVDESLLTLADADLLIEHRAADLFNIRVSKCGGLWRSMEIAHRAVAAGIGVQVGAQVGETAILSAVGRLLAAAIPEVVFTEGSYGTLLLVEDVSAEEIRFGRRGEARVPTGPGLGVSVDENRLRKHSSSVVELQSLGRGR